MMKVFPDHFSGPQQATDEIATLGLHFAEFNVPAIDGDLHWHRFDATLYVISGTLHLTDGATGKVHKISTGDKVSVPAGTLHAEKSEGYGVLLGSSIPPEQIVEPVDMPPDALPDAEVR